MRILIVECKDTPERMEFKLDALPSYPETETERLYMHSLIRHLHAWLLLKRDQSQGRVLIEIREAGKGKLCPVCNGFGRRWRNGQPDGLPCTNCKGEGRLPEAEKAPDWRPALLEKVREGIPASTAARDVGIAIQTLQEELAHGGEFVDSMLSAQALAITRLRNAMERQGGRE